MNAPSTDIEALIRALSSAGSHERQAARRALVQHGPAAASAVARALGADDHAVRWEAAKALTRIATPATSDALVEVLQDRDPGLRWLAAEALVRIGRAGVVPLLGALGEDSDSVYLREGTHHVLAEIAGLGAACDQLVELLEQDMPPATAITAACAEARDSLRG